MRLGATRIWALSLIVFASLIGRAALGAEVTADEAIEHVGETATVCGTVFAAYRPDVNKQPTFLNFDRPFPTHRFTAIVWGVDRPKFGEPESKYGGKRICVTGLVERYNGKAEIILTDPSQVAVKE